MHALEKCVAQIIYISSLPIFHSKYFFKKFHVFIWVIYDDIFRYDKYSTSVTFQFKWPNKILMVYFLVKFRSIAKIFG